MTKVVIDDSVRTRLKDLKETLEFVDETGRLLGVFTPSVDREHLQPQISPEEVQRRLQKGGGRPLAEILRDLEKRS